MGLLMRKKSSTFKHVAVCAVLTTATTNPLGVRAAPTTPFSDQTAAGVVMSEPGLLTPLSHTSLDTLAISAPSSVNEFLNAQNDIAVPNTVESDTTQGNNAVGNLENVSGDINANTSAQMVPVQENGQIQDGGSEQDYIDGVGAVLELKINISVQPHYAASGNPAESTEQPPAIDESLTEAATGLTGMGFTQDQVFSRTRRSSFSPRIVAGVGSAAGAAMVVVGALVGWRTASMRMRERRAAACASPSLRV